MNGKFRKKGSGLIASSLILSACAPGALQTQAHLGEVLMSFFSRTIVYMLWSRSDLIKKCQERLVELNGGNVLTNLKDKVSKEKNLDEKLKLQLIGNTDEALEKLKNNVGGGEVAELIAGNLDNRITELDTAINEIKEKENLYILSKSEESLLVEKLYDYSYMSKEDFEDIMNKIQNDESDQKVKFSFFPKGKEEEFYSLPYLRNEIKRLEENVQQKTKEAIGHFLINFVKKVEKDATEEAEESKKRLNLQDVPGESSIFSKAKLIIQEAFGDDKSDDFSSKVKDYILNLTRLRITHKVKEERAKNIKEKENANDYEKKKNEEKKENIQDRLEKLEGEGYEVLENAVNFLMENITKGGGELLDRLGASIGYIQSEDEELLKLFHEVDESKKELSYLKNEQKESEECVEELKYHLVSLENFKKSLDSLGEEEKNAIYNLADMYGFEGVQESESCEEFLDNYGFFEKMYSKFRELGIRKIKEKGFLKSCREEREKLESSRDVLYSVKKGFLNEMSKINSVSKKKVENLMNEFQDNRFYRSANTSEELVEKLLYGRTSDSN